MKDGACLIETHSLEGDHGDVDRRNVVDGIGDEARLVVQRLCVAHVVAHPDAPGQEQHLACGQTPATILKLSAAKTFAPAPVNYLAKIPFP